jgi:hypothetical protein
MKTHKNDSITKEIRRRFILGKQGLWPGPRWIGKDGTEQALREVEAIQVDPVSLIAQSHDIALWGRVYDYQPAYLDTLLYQDRKFFDYGGVLFIYAMEELPFWRVKMQRRKLEERWLAFKEANPDIEETVLRELQTRGPLKNRELNGKSVDYYRAGKDTGVVLYYLWLTGELMSHSRSGKERVYDFLENIAPDHLRWTASEEEARQHFIKKAISQRGLINERDFRNIIKSVDERLVDKTESAAELQKMIDSGQLGSVHFGGQPLFFRQEDSTYIESLANGEIPLNWQPAQTSTSEEVTFLSPLEYVSARGRAKEIFDFEFIWEIYKPASKRQYGPYTLPILYGDRLVGRMDSKLERSQKTLVINGLWFENWFRHDDVFIQAFSKGLVRFVLFHGARRVDTTVLNPIKLKQAIAHLMKDNGIETTA